MRQLKPIVDFLGLYKPELTAFLANSPAATQARDTSGAHYLRTTNPLNAENLAVYPRRVGTNRPNPYTQPGNFRDLARGLAVFDNRQCGAGVPNITNVPAPPLPPSVGDLVPQDLLNRIVQFAFAGQPGVNGPAPPCRLQGRYNFGGELTQYPHRARDAAGVRSRYPATRAHRMGFERIVRASARRPARVLAAVAVLAALGGALALRLEPSAAMDTLVGRGADTFQATETYRERFGDHSVIVLARGDLPKLVLTSNLGRLIGLEGCLSGNKPEGETAPGGAGSPCDRLAETKPVQVVYGPGTFINAAAGEINDQIQAQMQTKAAQATRAARAARRVARAQGKPPAEQQRLAESARQLVYAQFVRDLLQVNLRYGLGLTRLPSVDDPEFVSALVFDGSRGASTPKARFAYLFPSPESALIQVRLKPDLSDEQREEAVALVRQAVRMPEWELENAGGYTVTGAPVVADDLTGALAGSTLRLLVVGLVLMALVLALVFRSRLRLVPLAVALAAVAITFGVTALLGLPLTMASIAVLPVLLGLGVDYAIQYQARVQEEGGAVHGGSCGGARDRHRRARHRRRLPRPAAVARPDGARLRRAAGGGHRDRLRARADRRDGGALAADRARAPWRARCAAPVSWPTARRGRSRGRSPAPPAGPATRRCAAHCGGRAGCWWRGC